MERSGAELRPPQILLVLLCLVVGLLRQADGQVACAKVDACSCRLDSGDLIDLNPLKGSSYLKNGIKGFDDYVYHFSPCASELDLTGTCTVAGDTAMCQEAGDGFHSLGRTSTASFQVTTTVPYQTVITFRGGEETGEGLERNAKVTVLCDNAYDANLNYDGESDDYLDRTTTYTLTLRTKYGCPGFKAAGGGLSAGGILVIIFFVLLVVYLATGVAYMIARHEKRGIEVLPNLEFWRSVPGLIKDGGLFLLGLCKGGGGDGSSGKGSTYDEL